MSFGDKHDYIHKHIGFNYRMSDSQATKALLSLSRVESNLKRRKDVEGFYNSNLDKRFLRSNRECVWVYDINHSNPGPLIHHLNSKNIKARRTFAPMSMQPCFQIQKDHTHLVSYKLYNSTCYLPVSPEMSQSDVGYICDEIKNF